MPNIIFRNKAALIVSVCLILLTACTQKPQLVIKDNLLVSGSQYPKVDQQTRITWVGGIELSNKLLTEVIKEITSSYELLHPDIAINLEKWPVSDPNSVNSYLQERILSQEGPELYSRNVVRVNADAAKNWWIPLNNFLNQSNSYNKGLKWKESFIDEILDRTQLQEKNQYAVNYTGLELSIFYNKALFKKAGILEKPQTFSEMLKDMEKLKQASIPVFAGAIQDNQTINWIRALLRAHLSLNQSASTEEISREVDRLSQLWTRYLIPQEAEDSAYNKQLFYEGKIAILLQTDAFIESLNNENPFIDWGSFPVPPPSQTDSLLATETSVRFVSLDGVSLSIPRYVENDPEKLAAVLDFMKYLSSNESMNQLVLKTNHSVSLIKNVPAINNESLFIDEQVHMLPVSEFVAADR